MTDWQEIVSRHNQVVWKTAYRLLGNHADAADCLQETFLSALNLSRKQTIRNWSALLVRLATARAIDRLRVRIRRNALAPQQAELHDVPDGKPSPVQEAQRAELADSLRLALAQLLPQQSEAFCLRYLNDLSYDEIAQEMDLASNHVGVLLHRARGQLRLLLASVGGAGRDGEQP